MRDFLNLGPRPKAALVTLGQGYGNVVMATPVLAAVKSLGYFVDVLLESHQPDAATLLAGWDAVDAIYLDRRSLRRAEGGRGYDAIVRTVWNREGDLDLGPEFRPLPLSLDRHHEAEVNLTAARALGFRGPMPPPHVQSDPSFAALPERFLVVAPGWGGADRAAWARKAWPRWAEFGEACRRDLGLPLAIVGTESDAADWKTDRERDGILDFRGRTSIRRAAGIIARSAGVVALDNGLAHIGAALGRPVVALFGATSEIKNRPLGPNVTALAAGVNCRPCQMTARWDACREWRCMAEISVDAVVNAVAGVVEEPCLTA